MHIVCDTPVLSQAVATVERAVSNNEAKPILSGIYIQAADNKVKLVATDEEMAIERVFEAEVKQSGSCVIEGRLASGMVRRLAAEQTTIQLQSNNEALIQSGSVKFTVQTHPGEQYPQIPEQEDIVSWRLMQPEMQRMIRHTIFAVSKEESRANLTGVFIQLDGTDMTMVATDASRLALRKGTLTSSVEKQTSAIVPAKSLNELLRLLTGGADEELHVSITDHQINFTMPHVKFVSRLIDGQFPNYERVFPKSFETKFVVQRDTLLAAVDRASLIARKGPPSVRLGVADNVLTLTAHEAEVGQSFEEIEVTQDGENIEMAYQARYLSDVLRVIEQSEVVVEMGNEMLPAVLYGVEDDAYRYVVMPVRVG